MSHFSVAVFTEGGTEEEVDKLLMPYCEEVEDLPHELLEFEEDEDLEIDDETGKHGYWKNPKAKWDWYQIGGRWRGMLMMQDGKHDCRRGMPDWCYSHNNEYDSAKVAEIDFEAIKKSYIDDLKPFSEMSKIWRSEYFKRKYPDEETYVKKNTTFNTYAVLLPDGTWEAAGEMGWWGMSSETEEEHVEFIDTYFERFIKPAIENGWYMTIVDCHI